MVHLAQLLLDFERELLAVGTLGGVRVRAGVGVRVWVRVWVGEGVMVGVRVRVRVGVRVGLG